MKRIAVFCGSNTGNNPAYADAARQLAKSLVDRNIGLVYGAGNVGLMGVIADEVLQLGGEVIGVIPQKLVEMEVAHHGITRIEIVDTMHERKALMAELADAFIAMPGGIGTLEEIIEVFTWTQLGYHEKPCALLNTEGYYDHLIGFMDSMVEREFLKAHHRANMIVNDNPEDLMGQLEQTNIAYTGKWINR